MPQMTAMKIGFSFCLRTGNLLQNKELQQNKNQQKRNMTSARQRKNTNKHKPPDKAEIQVAIQGYKRYKRMISASTVMNFPLVLLCEHNIHTARKKHLSILKTARQNEYRRIVFFS